MEGQSAAKVRNSRARRQKFAFDAAVERRLESYSLCAAAGLLMTPALATAAPAYCAPGCCTTPCPPVDILFVPHQIPLHNSGGIFKTNAGQHAREVHYYAATFYAVPGSYTQFVGATPSFRPVGALLGTMSYPLKVKGSQFYRTGSFQTRGMFASFNTVFDVRIAGPTGPYTGWVQFHVSEQLPLGITAALQAENLTLEEPNPAPEPPTLALLALGFLGLTAVRRRAKRQAV